MRVRYALHERLIGERRVDLLVNCLQHIVRSSYDRIEVICVDDDN